MIILKERLTPCTTLLYHWLQGHDNTADTGLNLGHFQAWTEEFFEKPLTTKEVDRAFVRLMQLQLIRLEGGKIKVLIADEQNAVKLLPLPEKLWKTWNLEEKIALGTAAIASFVLVTISGFVLLNQPNLQPTSQQSVVENSQKLETDTEYVGKSSENSEIFREILSRRSTQ
jgi:hypothetical protein